MYFGSAFFVLVSFSDRLSPNGRKLATTAPDLCNKFIKESQLVGPFSGSSEESMKHAYVFKAEGIYLRELVAWVMEELRTTKEAIKKLGMAGGHYHSWGWQDKGRRWCYWKSEM